MWSGNENENNNDNNNNDNMKIVMKIMKDNESNEK